MLNKKVFGVYVSSMVVRPFAVSHKNVSLCCQAMQEFAHLCQVKDSKVVLSVLPLWPKVYAKLSIVSCSDCISFC